MTQPPVPPTSRPDADVDAPVATAAEAALVEAASPSAPVDDLPPVSKRYIWLQVLGQFGVFMAFITPIAISLALRIDALAPGHAEYLGYVTGAGALVPLLTGPFLGVLSDRMRTRWGRRRPMMVAGLVIGVIALFVMATAPNVLLLGVGWVLAQLGWGQVLGNLQISTADCLPEQQRGKVAGLTSFATQVAPVFGVILAQFFTTNSLLLFFVPGLVGVVFTLLFVFLIHEPDSRGMVLDEGDHDTWSCGSFFTNPHVEPGQVPDGAPAWPQPDGTVKTSAAWLIAPSTTTPRQPERSSISALRKN